MEKFEIDGEDFIVNSHSPRKMDIATESIDLVFEDVPAEKQTNQKTDENPYVDAALKNYAKTIQTAIKNGDSIYPLLDVESIKKIHAPAILYKGKTGDNKYFYPVSLNTIGLLQEQANRNTCDFRWMDAKEVQSAKDISIRKGAKAVSIVDYTYVSKEQRIAGIKPKAYTRKYFSVADLVGKGIPTQIPVVDHNRDVFTRNIAISMSYRTKDNDFTIETAKDYNKTAARAISYAEYQKEVDFNKTNEYENRLSLIMGLDPKAAKKPPEKFVAFLQEAYRQNPRTFVSVACVRAENELNFTKEHITVAIDKFAPKAAFDKQGQIPYHDRIFNNIEKNRQKEAVIVR